MLRFATLRVRRRVATVLALAALAGALGGPAVAGAEGTTRDPLLLGGYAMPRNGQSAASAVTALESSLGRQLGAVRVYDLWNSTFPDSTTRAWRDGGRTLVLSVKAKRLNGTTVTWRSIADAAPGSAVYGEITKWADSVSAFGAPLYFTFHHEPEAGTNLANGTAADFKDAWRKVVTVFRERGVTNATYLWTMTDYSFWVKDRREASLWYPGDDYVDAMGADAYNWYDCRAGIFNAWKSLEQIIDPFRRFGAAHPDKELLLPEWGSYEDPATPGRKAAWIKDAQALFAKPGWEQFTGILYYHAVTSSYPNCKWFLDTSTTASSAFDTMAGDPLYGGTGVQQPPPPPPPPPPPTSLFSSDFSGGLVGWDRAAGFTADSTAGGAAAPSARASVTGKAAVLREGLSSPETSVCQEEAVRVTSLSASVVLARFRTAGGTGVGRLFLTAGRELAVRSDVTGTQKLSGVRLPLGEWHTVELCATVGTSGTWEASLDGTPILSWTADSGTTAIGAVQVGDDGTTTATYNVDDVVVTAG
jgi:hypothetical protein